MVHFVTNTIIIMYERYQLEVLCATIHEGKIIVGCQYGLLVFWDIVQVFHIIILSILKRRKNETPRWKNAKLT